MLFESVDSNKNIRRRKLSDLDQVTQKINAIESIHEQSFTQHHK